MEIDQQTSSGRLVPLRDEMRRVSGGIPVYLSLCVELFHSDSELVTGSLADALNAEGLIDLYFRNISCDLQDALFADSFLEYWDVSFLLEACGGVEHWVVSHSSPSYASEGPVSRFMRSLPRFCAGLEISVSLKCVSSTIFRACWLISSRIELILTARDWLRNAMFSSRLPSLPMSVWMERMKRIITGSTWRS